MPTDYEHDEDKLDESLEETFPASDAPANTVETGVRPAPPADAIVSDNATQNRFELTVDGYTAYLEYQRTGETLTLVHTEVPVEVRGRHIANHLVDAAVQAGHAEGLRIVVVCPFARADLRKQRQSP